MSLELIISNGFVKNHLGLDLWLIVIAIIAFGAFYKLVASKVSSKLMVEKINNQIVLPLTAFFTIGLFAIESYTYPNFINSSFGINHFVLAITLLFTYSIYIFSLSKQVIQKKWQTIFFFGFLIFCFYVYIHHNFIFRDLSYNGGGHDDDNFMEWLQVGIVFFGSIVSFLQAFKARKKPLVTVAYIFSGLLFLFLLGEEISWGERFLSLSIELGKENYQNELNLHNREGLNELFALMYYVMFLYAFISWRIRLRALKTNKIKKRFVQWWQLLTFQKREMIYFIPTVVINPYLDRSLIPNIGSVLDLYNMLGIIPDFYKTLTFAAFWRETFEVLFYLGLFLHFWNIYRENHYKLKKFNNES